jgi:hypothetical protein
MSTEADSITGEPKSSPWTNRQLLYGLFAIAVLITIVALIAAQPQPEAIDYLPGP